MLNREQLNLDDGAKCTPILIITPLTYIQLLTVQKFDYFLRYLWKICQTHKTISALKWHDMNKINPKNYVLSRDEAVLIDFHYYNP